MGHNEGSPEREVHSTTGLPKNHTNISNEQHNPTTTRSQEKTTKTVQRNWKEGNNQDNSGSK